MRDQDEHVASALASEDMPIVGKHGLFKRRRSSAAASASGELQAEVSQERSENEPFSMASFATEQGKKAMLERADASFVLGKQMLLSIIDGTCSKDSTEYDPHQASEYLKNARKLYQSAENVDGIQHCDFWLAAYAKRNFEGNVASQQPCPR